MILDLMAYFVAFALCAAAAYGLQKTHLAIRIRVGAREAPYHLSDSGGTAYCLIGCMFLIPIIAFFGMRYGIGTDYFAYERFFNILHDAPFYEYWPRHVRGDEGYYVEIGYYFLNRIFPSFRWLLWGIGIMIFALVLLTVRDYPMRFSVPFAIFIYLAGQFIYAMNGMRFAIAVCFVLNGYKALSRGRSGAFAAYVLLGFLFHKTAIFCLAMLLLKEFRHPRANFLRDAAMFAGILAFPFLSGILLRIISMVPVFSRYYSTGVYAASPTMRGGIVWLLHIVPVLLPLVILCKNEVFRQAETRTLLRVSLMEFPFRMLGLYNEWYTRFARFAQVVYVILIPLAVSRVRDRNKRILLYAYYIAWFAFYFAYYELVNDRGDSLPYAVYFLQ